MQLIWEDVMHRNLQHRMLHVNSTSQLSCHDRITLKHVLSSPRASETQPALMFSKPNKHFWDTFIVSMICLIVKNIFGLTWPLLTAKTNTLQTTLKIQFVASNHTFAACYNYRLSIDCERRSKCWATTKQFQSPDAVKNQSCESVGLHRIQQDCLDRQNVSTDWNQLC